MTQVRQWTDANGQTFDEVDAARIAKEFEEDDSALDRAEVTIIPRVGRPAIAGGRGPSPQVTFRLSSTMRLRAENLAQARGTTVSALARQALEELVNRAG
ncbi:MAG: hypothetical protein KGN78_03715 [Actinomycetales bacterium]|nr:hypothetical protein [Actinomycetales bacterium]